MDQYLYEDAMAGKFGDGVVKLFTGVNEFYVDQYGLGYLSKGSSSYNSRTDTIISVIALVVILVVIASILDSLRYTSYRQRYYRGSQSPLCIPAHPVLARSRLWLVPAALAAASASSPRRSQRSGRTGRSRRL